MKGRKARGKVGWDKGKRKRKKGEGQREGKWAMHFPRQFTTSPCKILAHNRRGSLLDLAATAKTEWRTKLSEMSALKKECTYDKERIQEANSDLYQLVPLLTLDFSQLPK